MNEFFVDKGVINNSGLKKIEENITKNIPSNYIPIRMSSSGKFDCPEIIHVKNFSGSDIFNLSLQTLETTVEALTNCLNNMIYEDFDAKNLTEKELLEIIITVYANFWNRELQMNYPYDNEELETIQKENPDKYKLIEKGKIDKVIIDLSKLAWITLDNSFKEKLELEKNNTKVVFAHDRLFHTLIASQYIEKYCFEDEMKIRKLKEISNDRDLTYDESKELKETSKRKANLLYKLIRCQLIVSINGVELKTIDEKLKAFDEIDETFWLKRDDLVSNVKYGVDNFIKVKSPVTGKKVERRFSFRILEILSALQLPSDDGFVVNFVDK